ncbi:DUF2358 domain-containing protein [Waterburya agarophytonicola K14]|uniref:DUF2358 domain-containing protein n=1 Tax=Waterburya agarophytonicola KI4 TaxID=2874699 RepID=A0A964FEW3_9CYAN|nr:DUF2358 domain-containing protein [Waterburya agarophytonicola]MCC0176337.1 DUF2358 domain-containing protein [Waterburya agarophytonicola KI4]
MNNEQKDLVEILKQDYQRFPDNQTFEIYAEDVYFKDPLNEFRGVKKYREMIGFLSSFFSKIKMEVHNITQEGTKIQTEWTLNMNSPLPWKPLISIPGWSELEISEDNLVASHIDYWHISPWNVLSQNFTVRRQRSIF